ncbi:hypothetical protein E2C01_019054 [Portunus trituberculatus]|uniref:Uncharacterized protein n=1 Tax=Portunus trituberculatus TaxID=210409 RepID=A0A5B7DWN1_PORTR|nr:hypothetical protein [Portunus trituberculatus]
MRYREPIHASPGRKREGNEWEGTLRGEGRRLRSNRPNNVHYVHFGYIGQATDTTWGLHLHEAGTRPPGHDQGRSPGQQVLTRGLRRPGGDLTGLRKVVAIEL